MNLHPASLISGFVLSALLFTGGPPSRSGQDETSDASDLESRVQALEVWRTNTDSRLEILEKSKQAKGRAATLNSASEAQKVLAVTITDKRFDPSNARARKYEDNIWWDAEYTATGLTKPARSIKGVLQFCDLFGDPQFQVRVTLDDPINPGGTLATTGVGVEYNQFLDTHKWLRGTEIEDMTFRFQVETVLYQDGTTEKFAR